MSRRGNPHMRAWTLAVCVVAVLGLPVPAGAQGAAAEPKTEATAAQTVEISDAVLAEALLHLAVERSAGHLVGAARRYYQLGIRDRAIELYSEAIRKDSRSAAAFDGRARVLRDWGLHEQALGDAHRATYFAPSSAEAWNTVGTIFQALNRMSEARASFVKATLAGPAPFAWSNLCYLSFVSGQLAQASVECGRAIDEDPDHHYARNNLALIHAALGDLKTASELFLAVGGEAARHYNMGIVFLALKNYGAAARAFEAASRVDPAMASAHIRARDARLRARMETSK